MAPSYPKGTKCPLSSFFLLPTISPAFYYIVLMRALILSDIHGSADAARAALAYFEKFHCDKIFLLGDTLYHGPRNPLPAGHGPMGVVEALEPFKDKIVAVRGNCDADVDLMMLDFPIKDEFAVVEDTVKNSDGTMRTIRLFLSHGHIFMPECFPKNALECIERNSGCTKTADGVANAHGTAPDSDSQDIDAYLFGHTHIYHLESNFKGVLLVNPGSTSLPKGGNPPTFAIYDSTGAGRDSSKIRAKFSIHRLDDGKELASDLI